MTNKYLKIQTQCEDNTSILLHHYHYVVRLVATPWLFCCFAYIYHIKLLWTVEHLLNLVVWHFVKENYSLELEYLCLIPSAYSLFIPSKTLGGFRKSSPLKRICQHHDYNLSDTTRRLHMITTRSIPYTNSLLSLCLPRPLPLLSRQQRRILQCTGKNQYVHFVYPNICLL